MFVSQRMLRQPKLLNPLGLPAGPMKYVGPVNPYYCQLLTRPGSYDLVHPSRSGIVLGTIEFSQGCYKFPGGSSSGLLFYIDLPEGDSGHTWTPLAYQYGRTSLVVFRQWASQADGGLYTETDQGSRSANTSTGFEQRLVTAKLRTLISDKSPDIIYADTPTLPLFTWLAVVSYWPPSTSYTDIRVWVNGIEQSLTGDSQGSGSFLLADLTSSALQPCIGRNNYYVGTTYYYHYGEIAAVVVWDRILDTELCRVISSDPFSLFELV